MARKTIHYRIQTDSGVIEDSVTVENQTWNDRVARQYAAYHAQTERGVEPLSFDVADIETEIEDE